MISAISPKAIKVAFSKAVSDEEKAKLEVQVTASPVLTQTWVDGNASLELKRAIDFPEGKYTVVVKFEGKELAKKELEFKKAAPAKIVINGDVIAKHTAAKLDVAILDQYGEKVNPVPFATGFAVNKTEPGRTVTPAGIDTYNTDKCEMGDKIEITVVLDSDPTIKATKTLTVGYPPEKEIEVVFGEVKMPLGKTEINPGATFRIPVTVKKNGVELKPAADINFTNGTRVLFDGVGLAPFFDTTPGTTAKYVKADKEIEIFLPDGATGTKPNTYTFRFIDDKAVETSVSYVVVEVEKPALIVPVKSTMEVTGGENFKVVFKLFGDRGNELKWTDFSADYKVEETDNDGVATVGAWNNQGFIPYTTLAKSGPLGFVLKRTAAPAQVIEGSKTTVDVKMIEKFASIEVDTVPSTKDGAKTLKAGQKFTVVIRALDATSELLTKYNVKWDGVKIGYGTGSTEITLSRDVQFINGIAKVELVAKKSGPGKLKVTMPDAGSTADDTQNNLTVTEGDIAKLTVAKDTDDDKLDLTVFDWEDNKLATYNGTLNAVVTLPSPGLKVTGPVKAKLDSEGKGTIEFTSGEITLELNKDRVKGLYKVELTLEDGTTKVVGEYTEE